jgi:hypothetical protein
MFDSATACCFCAIVHDPRAAFFTDPNPLLLLSITLSNTRHMPRARLTRSKNYNPCAQTVRLLLTQPVGFGPFTLPAGQAVFVHKQPGSTVERIANVGNAVLAAFKMKMLLDYRSRVMTFYGDCR